MAKILVQIQYFPMKNQIANIMTKPLTTNRFHFFNSSCGFFHKNPQFEGGIRDMPTHGDMPTDGSVRDIPTYGSVRDMPTHRSINS